MEAALSVLMVVVIAVLALPSNPLPKSNKSITHKSSIMTGLESRFMETGWVDGNCFIR